MILLGTALLIAFIAFVLIPGPRRAARPVEVAAVPGSEW